MRRTIIAMLLCVGVVAAQQGGALSWNPNGSDITVNGPATNGTAFTYTLPARSGTLALAGDAPTPMPTSTPIPTPSTLPTPAATPTVSSGATTVTDAGGAVWTFGPQHQTLRNGVQVGGGAGTQYQLVGSDVYVLGIPNGWYRWTGTTWEGMAAGWQPPGVTASPTPTSTPSPSPTDRFVVRALPADSTAIVALIVSMDTQGYRYVAPAGSWMVFERKV